MSLRALINATLFLLVFGACLFGTPHTAKADLGADWQLANGGFPGRSSAAVVEFLGKLWMIGGSSGGLRNDVWSSADGVTWTQETQAAEFSPRYLHTCLVYDGKIWLIAGNDGADRNDVWSSGDGVTWRQATNDAPFSPRSACASVTFDGKMWVIGGLDRIEGDVGLSPGISAEVAY